MSVRKIKRRDRDFYRKAKSGEFFHLYHLPEEVALPVAIYWETAGPKLLAGMIVRESSQISIGEGSPEWIFKQFSKYPQMKIEFSPVIVPEIPKNSSQTEVRNSWASTFLSGASSLLI